MKIEGGITKQLLIYDSNQHTFIQEVRILLFRIEYINIIDFSSFELRSYGTRKLYAFTI